MISSDGFVPITAIFYAVFHPVKGTQIVHQVPQGSIGSVDLQEDEEVLFNFDTVKNYIIPKPQLCNKLVTFKINKSRVLGYPVNIEGSHYSRNSFNFNFGFVLPCNSDTTPYESAVSRMGKMFRALEEQALLLSKLDKELAFFSGQNEVGFNTRSFQSTPGHSKFQNFSLSSIESLIHQIYQDLNNYSECCIPIDSANSVDIKLFPILPPPVNLKAYQVPISTVKLNSLIDVVWDPTMVKILPFINGLNSVKKISELAGAEYLLTKQCIQHLMHYQCIILVDIFQFGNIYAPTNHIGKFLKIIGMAEECQAYIITTGRSNGPVSLSSQQHTPVVSATPASASSPTPSNMSSTPRGSTPTLTREITTQGLKETLSEGNLESASPLSRGRLSGISSGFPYVKTDIWIPSKATLFYLYRSLNQGQTIKDWYIQHQKMLQSIDVRRFINFGVIRGIIYRVNSYPILHWVTKSLEADEGRSESLDELLCRFQSQSKLHSVSTQEVKNFSGAGLSRSAVRESNLKMGKKTRTISFNYHVSRSNNDFRLQSGHSRPSSRGSRHTPILEHEDTGDDHDPDVVNSESEDSEESSDEVTDHKIDDVAIFNSDPEVPGAHSPSSENEEIAKLIKLVRGSQHFDSICTELHKSRTEVGQLLDTLGAHSVVNS